MKAPKSRLRLALESGWCPIAFLLRDPPTAAELKQQDIEAAEEAIRAHELEAVRLEHRRLLHVHQLEVIARHDVDREQRRKERE